MKKVLFILLSLLMYANSNAQKKNTKKATTKKQYKMEIPNITKEDIKLPNLQDLIRQENEKIWEKTKDSSKLLSENPKELRFVQDEFGGLYQDGKLSLAKTTEDNVQKPVPRKKRFNPEGVIEFKQRIQTEVYFYPSGSVHMIMQYNYNTTGYYPAGNWYVYDESGKLLQHIDHEKHFRMSYYDVVQIADSYDYPKIDISRGFDDKKSLWAITLAGYPEERPHREKVIIIDDKTGKVLHELNGQEEIRNFKDSYLIEYSDNMYKLFKN